MGEAIADFNMIEEGDCIMVCLSWVKDSYTMLEILRNCSKARQSIFRWWLLILDQKATGLPGTRSARVS